jgi:hypothetical protein
MLYIIEMPGTGSSQFAILNTGVEWRKLRSPGMNQVLSSSSSYHRHSFRVRVRAGHACLNDMIAFFPDKAA